MLINIPNMELKDATVEITDKCLLRCKHCSSLSHSEGKHMPLIDYHRYIDVLASYGVETVSLSGGEPFLHPDFKNILLYTTVSIDKVKVYTSGYYDASIPYKTLRECNATVVFSVYGAKAETHDSITQVKSSFSRTMREIKKMKKSGIHIEAHFVPMAVNYKEIIPLLETLEKIGIDKVSILRLVKHGRVVFYPEIWMLKEENRELKKILTAVKDKYPVRLGSPWKTWFDDCPDCVAGINKAVVSPDGWAYPCEVFKNTPVCIIMQGYINMFQVE